MIRRSDKDTYSEPFSHGANLQYEKHLRRERHRGSLPEYIWGCFLSLLLTLVAFVLVSERLIAGNLLAAVIILCALAQLAVQCVCFLHLNTRSRSSWNLTVFAFSVLIACIVVFGSLWIMTHLNRNMTPAEMQAYMEHQN